MNRKEHSRQTPKLKAFVLEPILTPSGLPIDIGEETTDLSNQDIDLVDDFDIDASTEAYIDETLDTETDNVTFISELPSDIVFCEEPFTSGVFTVDDSGEITVDFLFDGGRYEGELAIFSLDGMDEFEPGSGDFIQEAARRALSDSELGHIVIRDRTEGARFSGSLGEAKDWNRDDYLGAKTFQMRPGDEFGVMLVPNSTVENVFENPDVSGRQTPLFSMSTANPDDAFHVGQLVDVTGDGNTFVLEDQRIDLGSDKDYNDLIFQVRGATGKATLLDEVIDPADDWRNTTDLGQALVEYAKPYITPDIPEETEVVEPASSVTISDQLIADTELISEELPSLDVLTRNVLVDAVPEDQPLIGIIDTGFNGNNPDIDYSNVTLGSDRVDGDLNPFLAPGEGNEHGTHILGIITAEQDNGLGIDGINDEAPVWIGRGIGAGNWSESLVEFVDTFQTSDQPNAVVNLSLDLTQVNPDGTVTTRYELTPAERGAIEYARQNNVLLVVAAGNDGGVMSALGQAAQEFDNIITVGSAERALADPNLAKAEAYMRTDYSSYGYGLDIMAEGGTAENPILSTVGDGLGTMSGTSVATAKVTGAVSQVWAANPDLSYRQVIDLLKNTATDLSTTDWDAETGAGLLNLTAAISLARTLEPDGHTAPASWIPDTWSGAGKVTPAERAVQIYETDTFSGQVTATIGAKLRSGPGTSYAQVGSAGYSDQLTYDAWTEGEFIDYEDELGTSSNRWYRLAGTTQWISAAITTGEPPTVITPPPPPGYYPDLASLSDAQWNEYTKDNTRFDVGWPDFRDERHLTPESIRNIYTDLSNAIFGSRKPATAGYLLDPGYRSGIGKWHSGFDMSAAQGTTVKVAVSGTIVRGIQDTNGDAFIGVRGDDGKLWIYGHMGTIAVPSGRIEAGQVLGTIGYRNHLHLEVQAGPNYRRSQSADLNTVQNATLNPIKAFWEFKNANGTSDGGSTEGDDGSTARSATPGKEIEYTIKPGDTLWDIARRYLGDGNRWREIIDEDGTTFTETEARTLQIGQSVYIPVTYTSGSGAPTTNPPTDGSIEGMTPYVFGSLGTLDDTLWEIAERKLGSGFRWTEIRQADGTTFTSDEARRISRGTVVYLPTGDSNGDASTPDNPDDGDDGGDNQPQPISTVSEAGLQFIAKHEGLRLNLYNDPAGHCTIGVGHLVHLGNCNGSEPAEFRSGISEQRAYELLRSDANTAVQAVKNLVQVPLNQAQFDALTSFTFNLGAGNLQQSDLLERLNNGEYDAVPAELNRWVYGGGVVLPGLVARRQAEGKLFSTGAYA